MPATPPTPDSRRAVRRKEGSSARGDGGRRGARPGGDPLRSPGGRSGGGQGTAVPSRRSGGGDRPMNPARLSQEHGGAVLLVTGLLAAAGLLATRSLPSDIYPPLQFPRIAIIAHAGTIPGRSMMLSVTRPIEQA